MSYSNDLFQESEMNMNNLQPDQPCSPGCLSHLTHPCEKCGRVGGWPKGSPQARNVIVNTLLGYLIMESGWGKDLEGGALDEYTIESINGDERVKINIGALTEECAEYWEEPSSDIDAQYVALSMLHTIVSSGIFYENESGAVRLTIEWYKESGYPLDD